VIIRWGAALILGVGTGEADDGGVFDDTIGVAVALADGDGVAPGFWLGGTGTGEKKLHRNKITEESINASKSRFCCILY
jgi:hypothetical protein